MLWDSPATNCRRVCRKAMSCCAPIHFIGTEAADKEHAAELRKKANTLSALPHRMDMKPWAGGFLPRGSQEIHPERGQGHAPAMKASELACTYHPSAPETEANGSQMSEAWRSLGSQISTRGTWNVKHTGLFLVIHNLLSTQKVAWFLCVIQPCQILSLPAPYGELVFISQSIESIFMKSAMCSLIYTSHLYGRCHMSSLSKDSRCSYMRSLVCTLLYTWD